MRAGANRNTPGVVGQQLIIIRIYAPETSIKQHRLLDLQNRRQEGRSDAPWGCRWPLVAEDLRRSFNVVRYLH